MALIGLFWLLWMTWKLIAIRRSLDHLGAVVARLAEIVDEEADRRSSEEDIARLKAEEEDLL